jgi:hypothetical protein
MNFFYRLIILLSLSFLSTSCLKQTESITPLAEARTLAQLQRESMMNTALQAAGNNELSERTKAFVEISATDPTLFLLNLRYKINKMDVFETTHLPNSFEQIGNSFLRALAIIFLKVSGSKTIDIGAVNIPIPNLNLDFEIIKSIKLKRIYLEYHQDLNDSSRNIADFSFLKSIAIKQLDGTQLLSYKKTNNRCLYKCLDFMIEHPDILLLMRDANGLNLIPSLAISNLPKTNEFKLDGEIDLQIGIKLPF